MRASGLVLVTAVVLVGCTGGPGGSPGPGASSTPSATSPARTSDQSAAVAPSPSLDPAIAYAIEQRRSFGLRSDLEWVLSVAHDPSARISILDFPMTPAEEDEFSARAASYERLAGAVNRYAEDHANEFGGVWIDQPRHLVVSAWTANSEVHRLGILSLLGGPGPLDVVQVRYPEARLRDLIDRIVDDRAWLEAIGARFESGGVDVMANVAELSISSANPDAPALIVDHYGVPADALRVVSDGTGILLRQRGAILGTVRLPDGAEPGNRAWDLAWTPDLATGGGECGSEVGFGVPADGAFILPCAPGGWTVAVHAYVEGQDGYVVIGIGHAVVPEGGRVSLEITVDPEHPAPS